MSTDNEVVKTADHQEINPQFGKDAPPGGRAVLKRMLKDEAAVPLFLGQMVIRSLRDLGYNSTTSAVCEHVDNSIEWGATEVRIYFNQIGKRGSYKIDVLVLDNGKGMEENVLKAATAFGGSMVYGNRSGIGRYGMGMKAAALSISPVLEIYSWQQRAAIYNMILDVEHIGRDRKNMIELPDPAFVDALPSEIADILIKPMVCPKDLQGSLDVFATDYSDLEECLGDSGTIVFMPDCDRLTYRTANKLVDDATKELGRIYRRWIEKGVKIYINNWLVEAFDPTYWMTSARHTQVQEITEKQSRLVWSWKIDVPISERLEKPTSPVTVRLYALPYNDWIEQPRAVLKNKLHIFDDNIVSFVRNDREVEIGASYRKLGINKHPDNNWLRLQIDFGGELDEAFGIATNKQGVRPKDYVYNVLSNAIKKELISLRDRIRKVKSEHTSWQDEAKVSEAERRATDVDGLQYKSLTGPNPVTDEEKAALEQNLRGLAVTLKRSNETDDDAYQRIKSSTFITNTRHDEYWPFYHCDYQYGKVILTINTAHAFFDKIWSPLSEISKTARAANEDSDSDTEDTDVASDANEILTSVQLLLLSLARTQSQMINDRDSDKPLARTQSQMISDRDSDKPSEKMFEQLRVEWSKNLEIQLTAK